MWEWSFDLSVIRSGGTSILMNSDAMNSRGRTIKGTLIQTHAWMLWCLLNPSASESNWISLLPHIMKREDCAHLLLSPPESQTAEAPVKHITDHDLQPQNILANAAHRALSSSQKLCVTPSVSLWAGDFITSSRHTHTPPPLHTALPPTHTTSPSQERSHHL